MVLRITPRPRGTGDDLRRTPGAGGLCFVFATVAALPVNRRRHSSVARCHSRQSAMPGATRYGTR